MTGFSDGSLIAFVGVASVSDWRESERYQRR